jgi:hypothetical protein
MMITASLNGDHVVQAARGLVFGIYGRQFHAVKTEFMMDTGTNELFWS